MPPKDKIFLSLQKIWYKKLKESGFDDIEQSEQRLKAWHSSFFKVHYNKVLYEAKEEYYNRACQFLYEYSFKNDKEKLIWEMHANGTSIEEITKVLLKKGFKTYKNFVHLTIQRLSKYILETKKL